MPGVGTSSIGFEVVKSMRLPSTTPLEFTHFSPPTIRTTLHELEIPETIAKNIYSFSDATYVHGRGNFDCRAFLGYVMGWDSDITLGVCRTYLGNYVSPQNTRNGIPYIVSQVDGGTVPHSVLGIGQSGKSLSVAGVESPLVIADNADLLRVFGGFALLEVTDTREP